MNNYSDDGKGEKRTRPISIARLAFVLVLMLLGSLAIVLSSTAIIIQSRGVTSQQQQVSAVTEPSEGGTAAARPSATSPSGQPMPVGDIPGWHQIFTDDFTTDVPLGSFPGLVAKRWSDYPDGWKDTSKNGEYYPSRVVSIHNGVMNLYLHTENGIHMVAAPEPVLPGAVGREGGLLYGRYVIRFRADPLPGYKLAWLLWPDSEVWPRDGEIDFPEGPLVQTINGYMHRQNATALHDQVSVTSQQSFPSWHTATIEWTPTRLNFILDGLTILSTTDRIPDTPMHWVLQTETTSTPPGNQVIGDVQIDWVAVYVPSNIASILNQGVSFAHKLDDDAQDANIHDDSKRDRRRPVT